MSTTFQRYPDLEDYLDIMSRYIASTLTVSSIVHFGGITLDDFSKKYSIIEIAVALEKSLWNKDFDVIDELIDSIYTINEEYAEITRIYFIPEKIVENPRIQYEDSEGMITQGRTMELIKEYPLSSTDNFLIRNHGKVLYGNDMRESFPMPPYDCFWEAFKEDIKKIEEWVTNFPFQYVEHDKYDKQVDLLLYFPRLLYSLKTQQTIGKVKAAYWFKNEYSTDLGDFILEIALNRQRNNNNANVVNIIENSKELLLFTIKEAFKTKDIPLSDISSSVKRELTGYNYKRVFMEMRNFIS